MIYTKLRHLERYLGQSDAMDTAIRFFLTANLNELNKGRNEIDADRVFINRFGYETVDEQQAAWEGHAQYADIHMLLSGREKIGVSPEDALTILSRRPEADFIGYHGPVRTWFTMTPGDVLILYPEDAHMVKVMDAERTYVDKLCGKVKL